MNTHDQEAADESRMMNLYQRFLDSRVMHEYYGYSNFNNVGLWEDNVSNQKQACLHLMKTLAATIRDTKGRLLDIACGTGGYFFPGRPL
jgi:MPBQ/MSBQ methyltransferase